MKFKRSYVELNENVTFNKGDIKALSNILLTARCFSSKSNVSRQLELMLEDSDTIILSDNSYSENSRHPYRYITIGRKSSGKELAYITVDFVQELEPVEI